VGITVNGKLVKFDGNTNHLINNRASDNPIIQVIGDISVYSVFRRVRASRTSLGDGNPLIYALKKFYGHSIELGDILAFMPDFYKISKKVAPHINSAHVVPIPSSASVAMMCAKRIARSIDAKFSPSLLVKKTHRQVCADLDLMLRAGSVPKEDVKALGTIRAELNRSLSSSFSMKKVDHKLRKYFAPFKVVMPAQVPSGKSVLLVDDLLSSGTSLRSARDLLNVHGVSDVKFLCLLSSTDHFTKVV
jgi:hypothetical protein